MAMPATADSGTMRLVSILALSALFAGAAPTKTDDYYKLPSIERIGTICISPRRRSLKRAPVFTSPLTTKMRC